MEDGQEAPLKPSMSYTILLVKIDLQINSTNCFIDQNKKFKSSLNCQASCRVCEGRQSDQITWNVLCLLKFDLHKILSFFLFQGHREPHIYVY